MKFVCLGYAEQGKWEAMTEQERQAKMEECLAFDDVLQKEGRVLGGEALESASKARTLRYRNGKVLVTDGPYAETKEQLGGILVFEARDLDHAVQLMSKHPGVRFGSFEIRAADEEINQMIAERRQTATTSVR